MLYACVPAWPPHSVVVMERVWAVCVNVCVVAMCSAIVFLHGAARAQAQEPGGAGITARLLMQMLWLWLCVEGRVERMRMYSCNVYISNFFLYRIVCSRSRGARVPRRRRARAWRGACVCMIEGRGGGWGRRAGSVRRQPDPHTYSRPYATGKGQTPDGQTICLITHILYYCKIILFNIIIII